MNIGVVLVTFNRLDKLKIALSSYEKQTKKISTIIIVNNCSNDGTREFLEEYSKKELDYKVIVLNMSTNLGGAGGFFEGMKCAIKEDIDWVYVSDDDAYPKDNALYELEKTYEKLEDKENVSVLCSVVENNKGIDYGHRLAIRKNNFVVKWKPLNKNEYKKEYFDVDIFSYVGSAININKLFYVGLDRKDFFIYHDDQEHSLRLRKTGRIIVCTKSIIHHDTESKKYQELFWGNYYDTRNRLLMIKYNFPIRYFYIRYYFGYIRDCIVCSNQTKREILKAAYKDAKNNKTGLNNLYKPGWKAKSSENN